MTQAPLLAIAQKSLSLDKFLKAAKSGDGSGVLLLGRASRPYALALPASPHSIATLSSLGCIVHNSPASTLKARMMDEGLFEKRAAIVATRHQKPAYVVASLHLANALGVCFLTTPVINIERPSTIYYVFEDAAGGMSLKKDEVWTQRIRSTLQCFQAPKV